jgi:hypothetical protein
MFDVSGKTVPDCATIVSDFTYVRACFFEKKLHYRILPFMSTQEQGSFSIAIFDFDGRAELDQAPHHVQITFFGCEK